METIVAIHRNHFGEIISFVTSEGRVISYKKAIIEAENGLLNGVHTHFDSEGHVSLLPDHAQTFDHYPNLF
ncbi:DUF3892 domain-containing protein [Neobacillus thermocopriae]|uniref:DUF3892 domain-containing protein n=1 Tax=Neobacillus thermocopriae TaxID=1215031 RepID=UPI00399CFC1D